MGAGGSFGLPALQRGGSVVLEPADQLSGGVAGGYLAGQPDVNLDRGMVVRANVNGVGPAEDQPPDRLGDQQAEQVGRAAGADWPDGIKRAQPPWPALIDADDSSAVARSPDRGGRNQLTQRFQFLPSCRSSDLRCARAIHRSAAVICPRRARSRCRSCHRAARSSDLRFARAAHRSIQRTTPGSLHWHGHPPGDPGAGCGSRAATGYCAVSAAASGQNCAPAVWRVSRADLVGVSEAAARRAPGGPLNGRCRRLRSCQTPGRTAPSRHHCGRCRVCTGAPTAPLSVQPSP